MNNLIDYTDQRIQLLEKIVATHPVAYNIETFHALRVEIKKIRFILQLLRYTRTDLTQGKSAGLLKKIFRGAGRVRDCHIQNQILASFAKDPQFAVFREKMNQALAKRKKQFFRLMRTIPTNTLGEKLQELLFCTGSVRKQEVKAYLHEQEQLTIDCVQRKKISDKELHRLRKIYKKITYTRKILHLENDPAESKREALADSIGKWHDAAVTHQKLQKSFSGMAHTHEEQTLLKRMLSDLSAQSKRHHRRITEELSQTL